MASTQTSNTSSSESAKRITLRDIGKELGVSHSTVSLALNDHPRISQATRDRVKKAAKKMGYSPDPMLAALASYRRNQQTKPITASLAWINAWPEAEDLRAHHEFDHYWKGAYEAAKQFGYRLEEFRLDGKFTPQRLHQILSTRGIRGILLPPHRHQPDWQDFPWENYSVVRFGRTLHAPSCHVVTSDQVSNTILAFVAMHKRGYQRIGFVAPEAELRRNGIIFELGFMGGQRMVPDAPKLPPLLLPRSKSTGERRQALVQWIEEHKPDAIFTSLTDLPQMLQEKGYRVPEDIALAATTILDTPIDSGINQHPEEIGRVAFLTLNSMINEGSRGIPKIYREILVEGSWVNGTSLPPKGESAAR
ncbi:LacI family DNA-binding transcriptional regulator [Roseibacillus ishigakijimensis]|uniref:LacI family DNA-binding transcriptional regulator n=1 Tax=Roseibacillus ishigakijimensis TaxID=454146 RepID=A0A934VLK2_9BACT|nr:LacI family DNA-binding transcriptional regulator [Roseibacillus ishigakijimensis]MBK1834769.1 LacI family DNA-binding transcriptional regulator [Roseibacillus ishigakijimensis]